MNSSDMDKSYGNLQRPYTNNTFRIKLNQFEDLIAELTQQGSDASPEERRQYINENLRFDSFCEAIRSLFGADIRNQDLKATYRKITTNPDAKVDWSELFGYFQSENEDQEQMAEEVSVFTVSKKTRVGEAAGDKKRRDVILRIVYNSLFDIYLTASQKGVLCSWNGRNMRLQSCNDIQESAWVTGCDYLPSLRRVVATTERSIAVWDNRAKGAKNQSIFIIKHLDYSPQCMTFAPYSNDLHEDSILIGDEQGYISLITIAAKDLNTKNAKVDKKNSQNLLIETSSLTHHPVKRKIHDEWALKIKYFPELNSFGSCSSSSNVSFVLDSVERITDTQPFKYLSLPKGVNCFTYSARANVIATGGGDKVIRVWHPHIFSRPTGKLIGHIFTITEIVVNEKDQHFISLSSARVFRVWDIHTLTSLQVFTDNEERPGEKRIHCMLFDEKYERLLTGSGVLDAWPLTRAVQDTMQVPHTHDRPISHVLYNRELNQVVSVCTESIIKVWEMEAGKLVYQLADSHGPSMEVTAMALDKTGYRLATGAIDGSLKIWDFGSGQEIRSWSFPAYLMAEKEEDNSVIDMVYHSQAEGKRCIIALGWNNKIKLFEDVKDGDLIFLLEFSDVYYFPKQMVPQIYSSNPFSKTVPLPKIGTSNPLVTSIHRKEEVLMTHEVTCLSLLPENNLVCTGCSNGNLILWDTEESNVHHVFQLPDASKTNEEGSSRRESTPADKLTNQHRVNMVRFLVRKTRKPDPAYIKKLTGHVSGQSSLTENENDGEASEYTDGRHSHFSQDWEDATDPEDSTATASPDKYDDFFDVDPEAKMIETVYSPVIVSCHQDAMIRFWNMQGEMVREIYAHTHHHATSVTAVSSDKDCNLLVTGDLKGYVTLWEIGAFLENPSQDENDLDVVTLSQMISWRAHLNKVMSLTYVETLRAIISSAIDGSVRVWYGNEPAQGHFMGFFGQHRKWNFPSIDRPNTPLLPYDITEVPLRPTKKTDAHKKKKQSYEYPLVFDKERWQPFRRSAYFQKKAFALEPEDKKFFGALQKPQFYNDHLESFRAADSDTGAVFRSLPVYRVKTPERLKTPPLQYLNSSISHSNDSFLFIGNTASTVTKHNKTISPVSKSISPVTSINKPSKVGGRSSVHQLTSSKTISSATTPNTNTTLSPLPSPRKR